MSKKNGPDAGLDIFTDNEVIIERGISKF